MNDHPQELRDLVSEHKTPDKIMELTTVEERAADEVSEHKPPDKTLELTTPGERPAGAGQENKEEQGVSPVQDDVCETMLIPRLPILDEVSARKSEYFVQPRRVQHPACSPLILGEVKRLRYRCMLFAGVSPKGSREQRSLLFWTRFGKTSCLGHAMALV